MRTSVVVRLAGGLGNQMFQYAAGRAVALASGRSLLLDGSGIARGPSDRRYELGALAIAGEPAEPITRAVIRAQVGGRVPPALRAVARAVSRRQWTLLGDSGSACDERLFTTAGDLVLDGFWQSAAYAERSQEIEGALRREFSLRDALPNRLATLAREIEACESVCVHVRRGDYVVDPLIAAVHGALPPEYHSAAGGFIAAHVPGAAFFVFSDDMAWAREHLRLPGPTRFVDAAEGLPAMDQRLMASCRHFIIANSTFSWWAAWLGAWPAKRVVAPRRWFVDRPVPAGLLPDSWMIV